LFVADRRKKKAAAAHCQLPTRHCNWQLKTNNWQLVTGNHASLVR
jgi:hypothetical protein